MDATERVLAACEFRRPDRIPRFDSFWKFPEPWRERLGVGPEELTDISIWTPDETTWPSRARRVRDEENATVEVDGWGRMIRKRKDAYLSEILESPCPEGTDFTSVTFDPASLDSRYLRKKAAAEMAQSLALSKSRHAVFGKTGGPFLRSCFIRGEEQFLLDIAGDPPLARLIADKVAEHLIGIGLEAIRRWDLRRTGVWIYDDMGYNHGPMFRPASFEQVFLPAYRRMVAEYKKAGARYVFLHSDGDIRPLLDMLVEAGIDGINPLERRANMDIVTLRKKYPKLILTGGMCNTDTLVHGPVERIVREAREIIDLGRDGGIVIGTHSVSADIPLEYFAAYHETCVTYGDFSKSIGG